MKENHFMKIYTKRHYLINCFYYKLQKTNILPKFSDTESKSIEDPLNKLKK